jgi:hypothetical protein
MSPEPETFAERTAETGVRADEHMIYEMGSWSQYSDGSVLDCISMKTFTAQEVADGDILGLAKDDPSWAIFPDNKKVAHAVGGDLKRNAKPAIKNGTTKNLAPRV